MSYASRVILHLPLSNEDLLDAFVEQCLRDNVALIAVVGEGAARIEDIIDELVVSDGSDDTRFGFGVRRLVERRAKSARPNSKVIVRNNAGSGSFASILAVRLRVVSGVPVVGFACWRRQLHQWIPGSPLRGDPE